MSGFRWGSVTAAGSVTAIASAAPALAPHPRLTEGSVCFCGSFAVTWEGKPVCGAHRSPQRAGLPSVTRATARGPWARNDDLPDPWLT